MSQRRWGQTAPGEEVIGDLHVTVERRARRQLRAREQITGAHCQTDEKHPAIRFAKFTHDQT